MTVVVQKGVPAHLINDKMKMTCYSYEDLIKVFQTWLNTSLSKTIMNKHLNTIKSTWRQEWCDQHRWNPQAIEHVFWKRTFESKVRHDFGDEHAQRLHQNDSNNANSSRAHTFIRLVIRKSGKIVSHWSSYGWLRRCRCSTKVSLMSPSQQRFGRFTQFANRASSTECERCYYKYGPNVGQPSYKGWHQTIIRRYLPERWP
jgi:hypothetical protein